MRGRTHSRRRPRASETHVFAKSGTSVTITRFLSLSLSLPCERFSWWEWETYNKHGIRVIYMMLDAYVRRTHQPLGHFILDACASRTHPLWRIFHEDRSNPQVPWIKMPHVLREVPNACVPPASEHSDCDWVYPSSHRRVSNAHT